MREDHMLPFEQARLFPRSSRYGHVIAHTLCYVLLEGVKAEILEVNGTRLVLNIRLLYLHNDSIRATSHKAVPSIFRYQTRYTTLNFTACLHGCVQPGLCCLRATFQRHNFEVRRT
jgi:hypothetical protein